MHVILFDIDGTLIHTGGAGRAALDVALEEAFAMKVRHEVPVSGRTDRGIARDLFLLHGIEDSQENWDRFRATYLRNLAAIMPRRQGRILAGVTDLLGRLAACPQARLGLLTGNVREGAKIKLSHFQLHGRFAFGGYGDHHADRNDVAREALGAAERHLGGPAAQCKLWVIGDTLFDIRCARAIGARAAAVATGTETAEALAAEGPDLLLRDMSDADRICEQLLGC